jgi:hypothetical protein
MDLSLIIQVLLEDSHQDAFHNKMKSAGLIEGRRTANLGTKWLLSCPSGIAVNI